MHCTCVSMAWQHDYHCNKWCLNGIWISKCISVHANNDVTIEYKYLVIDGKRIDCEPHRYSSGLSFHIQQGRNSRIYILSHLWSRGFRVVCINTTWSLHILFICILLRFHRALNEFEFIFLSQVATCMHVVFLIENKNKKFNIHEYNTRCKKEEEVKKKKTTRNENMNGLLGIAPMQIKYHDYMMTGKGTKIHRIRINYWAV